jgi:hypothetical protein
MPVERERMEKSWVQCRGDPLLWALTRSGKLANWQITLAMVLLTAAVTFGIGAILSYVVYADVALIRVFDPEHLFFALATHLVFLPIVWIIYLWQPRGIVDTLDSLRSQSVIPDAETAQFEELCQTCRARMNWWGLPILAIAVVVVLVALQTILVFPAQMDSLGRPYFWFYNKACYYLLFTLAWMFTYYATAMVVLKGVLSLATCNYVFRTLRIDVHPLHPDGAGGLGAIGRLAARYGLIGIAIGIMAAAITADRVLLGLGWAYPDAFALYALYVIITPTALILPMWSAHERMVEARDHLLEQVSAQFETLLRDPRPPATLPVAAGLSVELPGYEVVLRRKAGPDNTTMDVEGNLEKLEARHRLIKDTYPTWPIPSHLFRNLSITALLPLVTSLMGILADVLI